MQRRNFATLGGALAAVLLLGVASCSTFGGKPEETKRIIPLMFAGPSTYAAMSGVEGKAATLEPFAEDMAVERISWQRVGILPCLMHVYKRAPNNPDRIAIDKSEQCEGAKGDTSPVKSVGELNAAFSPTMRVITALRLRRLRSRSASLSRTAAFPRRRPARRSASATASTIAVSSPNGRAVRRARSATACAPISTRRWEASSWSASSCAAAR